jgi:hypothetical protein
MTTSKQTFPAVTIEALPNGLLRLEDETAMDGCMVVDLHPVQVQTLAAMVGFEMTDRTHKALGRVLGRLRLLHRKTCDVEKLLDAALRDGEGVAHELTMCEFIAANLGEVVRDIEDLQAPDLEPMPDAMANPGGQLTLPV